MNFQGNPQRDSKYLLPWLLLPGLLFFAIRASGSQSEQEIQETAEQMPAATSPATPVTGEVPSDLLESIIVKLSKQENFDREAITVVRSESVIWPDGSLGCPKPGEMYTQALVEGYWVVLRAAQREFDYRASNTGHFIRCKISFKIQLPVG